MQEEQQAVPESKKYNNEKLSKEYKINIQLISETSLQSTETQNLSQEEKIEAVIQLRSIHLQWLNIRKIENLEVFTNLNVLYLQNNKISKIENLDCLKNLEYLALNDNLISKVENLVSLGKLAGLNLNSNQIEEVDAKQLPKSLQLLSFKENPICLDTNYKIDIIKGLPMLEVLDDLNISPEQRLKIIGRFPQRFIDYSEKMKQFRNKQAIKKQLGQDSQPLYLGSGNINPQEGIKQLRQKTRKTMHIEQQQYKEDSKDQVKNFDDKIKVSRKIREFKENNEKKLKMSQIMETTDEHDVKDQ